MSKKRDPECCLDQPVNRRGGLTATAMILCQHLVLWGSIYVFATAVYIFRTNASPRVVMVCDLLTLVTALDSMLVILAQQLGSHLSQCTSFNPCSLESLRQGLRWWLPAMAVLWLTNCGLMAWTLFDGHRMCALAPLSTSNPPANALLCKLQLGNAIACVPIFIISSLLWMLTFRVGQDPFTYHLFGMNKKRGIDFPDLVYTTSAQRANSSAMSFKCRSSTSLSSPTLAPLPDDCTADCTADCLPPTSKKAGLGSFTQKPSNTRSSFLTPRPSLSSISSSTKLDSAPPPSTPLPPLPPYMPKHRLHRGGVRRYRAIPPPQPKTQGTVRIVPPSPAPIFGNLARHTSQDSLSSVYSQAVTGERYSVVLSGHRRNLTSGSRNLSSFSTATVRRSPLGGTMRLAEYPGIVSVLEDASATSADIDDVVTLEARLSSLNKGSGRLGDDWPALVIPKTREGAMTQPQGVVYGIAV